MRHYRYTINMQVNSDYTSMPVNSDRRVGLKLKNFRYRENLHDKFNYRQYNRDCLTSIEVFMCNGRNKNFDYKEDIKERAMALSRLKTIFPHVCTGEYNFDVLGASFSNFLKALYDKSWFSLRQTNPIFCYYNVVEICMRGKGIMSSYSKATHDTLKRNTKNQALIVFIRNFSFLSKVYYPGFTQFESWVSLINAISVVRNKITRGFGNRIEYQMKALFSNHTKAAAEDFKDAANEVVDASLDKIVDRLETKIEGIADKAGRSLGSGALGGFLSNLRERWQEFKVSVMTFFQVNSLTGLFFKTVVRMLVIGLFFYGLRECWKWISNIGITVSTVLTKVMDFEEVPKEVEIHMSGDYVEKQAGTWENFINYFESAANVLGANFGMRLRTVNGFFTLCNNVSRTEWIKEAFKSCARVVASWFGYDDIFNEGVENNLAKMDRELNDLLGGRDTKYSPMEFNKRIIALYYSVKKFQATFLTTLFGQTRLKAMKLIERTTSIYEDVLNNHLLTKERVMPAWWYMTGLPKQGKTRLWRLLSPYVYALLRKRDRKRFPKTKSFVYSKAQGTEYWDQYSSQEFIFGDEIFSSLDPGLLGDEARDWLGIVNSAPKPLNMAHVDKKGKCMCTSSLVCTTTNYRKVRNINITSPQALVRRMSFPLIIEKVKDVKMDISAPDFDEGWAIRVCDKIDGLDTDPSPYVLSRMDHATRLITPTQLIFATVEHIIDQYNQLKISEDAGINKDILDTFFSNIYGSVSYDSESSSSIEDDSEISLELNIERDEEVPRVERQMFSGGSWFSSNNQGKSASSSESSFSTTDSSSSSSSEDEELLLQMAQYYEDKPNMVESLVATMGQYVQVQEEDPIYLSTVKVRKCIDYGKFAEIKDEYITKIAMHMHFNRTISYEELDCIIPDLVFLVEPGDMNVTSILFKGSNLGHFLQVPLIGLDRIFEGLVQSNDCTDEEYAAVKAYILHTRKELHKIRLANDVDYGMNLKDCVYEDMAMLKLNPEGLCKYSCFRRSTIKCMAWGLNAQDKFNKAYKKFMKYVRNCFENMRLKNRTYYNYVMCYLDEHGMLPGQMISSFVHWMKIKCLDTYLGPLFLTIFSGAEGDWRKCCSTFWSDFKAFVVRGYKATKSIMSTVCGDLLLVTKVLVTALLLGPTLISLIKALRHAVRCVICWITPERYSRQSLYRGNKHGMNHKVPQPVNDAQVVTKQQTSVNMFNGQAKVLSNVKKIQFQFTDGSVAGAYALFVKGRSFITSAHVCPKGKQIAHCTINGRGCKGDEIIHVNVNMLDRKYYGKRDFVCITSRDPTIPLAKNLISKFPEDHCERIEGISRLRPEVGAKSAAVCISNYKEAGFIPLYKGVDLSGNSTNDYNVYYVPGGMGQAGYCGLPYTSGYSAVVINGIHTAAVGNDSLFTGIVRSDFDHLQDEWAEGFQEDCLLKQADFCSIAPLGAYGSSLLSKTVADNPHNDLVPTRFNGGTCITSRGAVTLPPFADVDKVPVMVKDYEDEEGNKVSVHANACKFHRTENPAMPDDFRIVMESSPSKLWEGMTGIEGSIDDGEFVAWRPSVREAVLGVPGEYDGLDDSTSPGYLLWSLGYKRKDLWNCTEKYVSPKLEKMVEEIESLAENKICVRSKVIDNKKAELRPKERLNVPRLFCATSAEMCVFVKRNMQAAISYLKKKGFMGSSAVGVNPYSTDWSLIYKYLSSLHPECKWMCGDFSAFDMSVPGYMAHVMFLFTNTLYKYKEGSKKYNCLYVACLSVTQVYHVFRNVAYEVSRGNSSGNWLTGYFNGIVNYVTHKWIFDIKVVPYFPSYKFSDYVRIKVFGDDALLTVHPAISHLYNMKVVSVAMKQEFGMIYTKSDKSAIDEGFVDFEDANFLCRYFYIFEGCILSKLEYASIVSPLLYYRRGSVRETEHLVQNIKCAYYEMFTHGEDKYNEFRTRMQYYCKFYRIRTEHPTYSHTRDMYMSQYRDQCFPNRKDELQLY